MEKSFFDRGAVHAKAKMFRGVLEGAFRERVAPGKRTERGYCVKAEARVIHAAFHASPRPFQLLKDHSWVKCTRQDESTADVSRDLPLTANHGCRIWTLCIASDQR